MNLFIELKLPNICEHSLLIRVNLYKVGCRGAEQNINDTTKPLSAIPCNDICSVAVPQHVPQSLPNGM